MPRAKRTNTRISRNMGRLSGTTVGVWPSGVTICEGGIEYTSGSFLTPTELGYLNTAASNLNSISGIPVGNATAGLMISGGSFQYVAGGSSYGVVYSTEGITTLYSFNAVVADDGQLGLDSGTTPVTLIIETGTAGVSVTPCLWNAGGVSTGTGMSGGTIYWTAFHA